MLLIVAVAACSPEAGVREPESYLPSNEVQPLEPDLSGDEVAEAVIDLLSGVPNQVPSALPELLDTLMTYADGSCPYTETFDDGTTRRLVWYDECTATSGATFYGGFELTEVTDEVDDYGNLTSGFEFYTQDLRIETPDGRFLTAGGYFNANRTEGKGVRSAASYLEGQIETDATSAAGNPWLLGEVSGSVYMYVADFNGYEYFYVNGSWPLDGDRIVGVAMQDVVVEPGSCETEPLGQIAVREPNGVWHDISFAWYSDEDETLYDCDGCGSHQAAGVPQDSSVCFSAAELDGIVDLSGGLPW